MTLEERRNLFLRIDQLIRLRIPGTAFLLARRLNISRSTFFRCLDEMKSLGAPIRYDELKRCYYYKEPGGFIFGYFRLKELKEYELKMILGGRTLSVGRSILSGSKPSSLVAKGNLSVYAGYS